MRLLDDGDVALVSDAGTPGVNDPGQAIVAAAINRGHDVVPIPGPSSVMAALSVCGFYADQFASYGFLPANGSRRRRVLRQIAGQSMAAVMFETPHRLRDALADTAEILGDRNLVVCREMTKMHEEIWRGTADEALLHFEKPRGEFVIVVAPLERLSVCSQAMSAEDAEREILNIAAEWTMNTSLVGISSMPSRLRSVIRGDRSTKYCTDSVEEWSGGGIPQVESRGSAVLHLRLSKPISDQERR